MRFRMTMISYINEGSSTLPTVHSKFNDLWMATHFVYVILLNVWKDDTWKGTCKQWIFEIIIIQAQGR